MEGVFMEDNGKPKVLIIDDRHSSRESVSFALVRRYDCLLAESAQKGLQFLDEDDISVIILDIRMPGLNGIEALRIIKEKAPTVEVIMLTGYASLDTAKQSITHGAYGYLTKPFDLADLRSTVDKACEKRMQALHLVKERDNLKQAVNIMQKEIGNLSRLADVGWLSAGIVHEMKSPLTAILGYAELMLRHLESKDSQSSLPPESARYLEIIKEETTRCAEMAKTLLEAARSGGSRPQPAPVSRILENVETLIRPQVHVNHVQFQIERPTEPLDILCDPDDVLQVILNLVLNAIHAMKSDKKELRVVAYAVEKNCDLPSCTENEEEFLSDNQDVSFAAIEVLDTGPGIPPEQIEHVFDAFYTTNNEPGCAGLGLPICNEKIERNSGHIDIVASSSEGTTFRMLIPVPA
jgi:two-component system sensor histidine kinase HydH